MKISSLLIGSVPFMSNALARVVLKFDKKAPKRNHWIILLDVSGSMGWALTQAKRDISGFVATLPEDDLVSIITFSGHQQATLVAGPTACSNGKGNGKDFLYAAIEKIRILGVTVFSEPLEMAVAHVKKMASADANHQAVLFTDGCPVPSQWDEATETRKAQEAASKLLAAGVIVSTIGYGNYYDADFLGGLVTFNGGSGVRRHINDITGFASVVTQIHESASKTALVKVTLKASSDKGDSTLALRATPEVSCVGEDGQIVLHSVTDGEVTLFVSLPKGSTSLTLKGTVDGAAFEQTIKGKALSDDAAKDGAFAAAAWAFETGDRRRAAEILRGLGNEMFAMLAENANTTRERLSVGDDMRRVLAERGIRQRYSTKKFIGAGQAACVVNLLRVLLEEDCTMFIPEGTYVRTTTKTVEANIRRKPHAKLKATEIQSHDERYNISLKVLVEVEEKKEGATEWTDGVRFRNFVIIKDGSLHQDKLEAYLTEKAFDLCLAWGVIADGSTFSETKLFTLDLSVLPMIIASWANPKQIGMVDLMIEEMVLSKKLTAVNARIKALRTKKADDWFGKTKAEPNDQYSATAYAYDLQGFKAPEFDASVLATLEEAEAEGKKVRKRQLHIRCIIRLVCFALDMTGNKLFDGVPAAPNPRSKSKMQQIIKLGDFGHPELSLRRQTWTEIVPVTSEGDDE